MTSFTTSADGTPLAYDLEGEGPAVVLVAGAFQFRGFDPETRELARLLAARGFTVLNYDRRGRGESGGDAPITLADTIADLGALLEVAGGSAALFGSSSGGAIALAAAASGLPVDALALWEVPLGDAGERDAGEFLAGLRERIRVGAGDAIVEYFMKDMPPEWLSGAKAGPGWPTMVAMGPSLEPDAESLALAQSAPHAELWGGIEAPVATLVGADTLELFSPAADSIVAAVPGARRITVPGADHRWDRDAMVGILADFLAAAVRPSA